MKQIKLFVAILFVILALFANLPTIYAQENPNTITFDNQSQEPALVKLIGPTDKTIKIPVGQSRTVNTAAGEYYILVRYGNNPDQYSYSKGDTFTVRQTSTQYSAITITLHKVIGGNYPIHAASREEFEKAITQEPAASRQSAQKDKIWKEPTTGMEFVWVPSDCFQMGDPSETDSPVHEVCVDAFWMGKFEVTNAQYRKFRSGHNIKRSYFGHSLDGDAHPAVDVSWEDAKAFAKWISLQNGGLHEFRLPTEAEWEYAVRAGTKTAMYWGDDPDDACEYSNVYDRTASNAFGSVLRFQPLHNCDDGYAVTAPVGRFKPNGFGLYDMLGNVAEWCEDVYDKNAYSSHSRNNPVVTSGGSYRVHRGGSWGAPRGLTSSGFRGGPNPYDRMIVWGFRLLRK